MGDIFTIYAGIHVLQLMHISPLSLALSHFITRNLIIFEQLYLNLCRSWFFVQCEIWSNLILFYTCLILMWWFWVVMLYLHRDWLKIIPGETKNCGGLSLTSMVHRIPCAGSLIMGSSLRLFDRWLLAACYSLYPCVGWTLLKKVVSFLPQTEEDGRVFPVSNTSASIVDCLLSEANRSGGMSLRSHKCCYLSTSSWYMIRSIICICPCELVFTWL